MTLSSRYGESLEAPKLFMVSSFYPWNVLISSNTNTFGKLIPNHKTFSGFISTKTDIFREFLPDNEDFFRVHIYQSHYQFLHVFKYQYWKFHNYYQTIHTSQSSYISILIFRESLTNYTYFHNSYKPLLTNKSEKTFLEFI